MKKIITLALVLLITTTAVQAAPPRDGKYMDAQGHIFIMKNGRPRTGYFKYKGHWYYGHGHNSRKYPRGSVTTGEMRVTSTGRWYAFDSSGRRIEKDVYVRKGRTRRLLQVDIRSRNSTVRYIYGTARGTIGTRYSTSEGRMQEMDSRGRWRTIEGMPFYPDYTDLQR